MSERKRQCCRRRRPAGLAWLAILALLLDALLPSAVTAAADPLAASGSFYCGALPGRSGPAKQAPAAPHQCLLCLAAVNGLPPRHAPTVPLPAFTETAFLGFTRTETAPPPLFLAAAQPRGPPLAA